MSLGRYRLVHSVSGCFSLAGLRPLRVADVAKEMANVFRCMQPWTLQTFLDSDSKSGAILSSLDTHSNQTHK